MSDNSSTTTRSSGLGFGGLLTIVFITLQLTGVINWSWWLILLPLYGPLTIVLILVLVGALLVGLGTLAKKNGPKR